MEEKTKIYDSRGLNISLVSDLISEILKETFHMDTNIIKLENLLYEVDFYTQDMTEDVKKNNKIYVLIEDGKLYLRFRGALDNLNKFWELCEEKLREERAKAPKVKKEPELRGKVPTVEDSELTIEKIINEIKNRGFEISRVDATNFIINFLEKFGRFPTEKELSSIIEGYIKMVSEESISMKPLTIEEEIAEEKSIPIQETEAAIPEEESDENIVIEQEIDSSISDSSVSILEKPMDEIMSALTEFETLSEAERVKYHNLLGEMDSNEQELFINRLREIVEQIEDLVNDGMVIDIWERVAFREQLIQLTKKERDNRWDELIGARKRAHIRAKLIEKIPQLAFEKAEEIIKELYWLSIDERDKRIEQLKAKFQSEIAKKQELFEKSGAGTTCPDCGWPLGSFSKKCPRCGRKMIEWL